MARYKIITLVDITRSTPSRTETNKIKLGQQANFNTLLQTIGLRSNISWIQDPVRQSGTLPEPFDGRATYWIWEIETERDSVFDNGQSPVGLLLVDLDGVPVIDQLNNSVDINPPAFKTQHPKMNIWVEEINISIEANI
jgi:hypothetical protein